MDAPFQFQFEWDFFKAKQNSKKHRITFERAATVFLDPEMLSTYDEEHSGREDRWITLGMDRTATLLVVCHTFQEQTAAMARIRIISGRKATKNESKQYERR